MHTSNQNAADVDGDKPSVGSKVATGFKTTGMSGWGGWGSAVVAGQGRHSYLICMRWAQLLWHGHHSHLIFIQNPGRNINVDSCPSLLSPLPLITLPSSSPPLPPPNSNLPAHSFPPPTRPSILHMPCSGKWIKGAGIRFGHKVKNEDWGGELKRGGSSTGRAVKSRCVMWIFLHVSI